MELAVGDSPRSRHDGYLVVDECVCNKSLTLILIFLTGLIASVESAHNPGSLQSLFEHPPVHFHANGVREQFWMRKGLQQLLVRPNKCRAFVDLAAPAPSLWAPCLRAATGLNVGFRGAKAVKVRQKSALILPTAEKKDKNVFESSVSGPLLGPEPLSSLDASKEPAVDETWKKYLQTFEQYQKESDFLGSGPYLVDQPVYAKDFDLWLELIRFRRRHHGVKGLEPILTEMIKRGLKIPFHGSTANEIWECFLLFGWEVRKVWELCIPYALEMKTITGSSWPGLYYHVLCHAFKYEPNTAARWHERLRAEFPPSSDQMKELFKRVIGKESSIGVFKRMYIDLPIRDMYSTVIPSLCDTEKYAHAVKWHNLMMRMGDKPSNAKIAEPLLHHLAIYGEKNRLVEMTKGMTDAGVSFAEPADRIKPEMVTRELLNRRLGENHGIAPKHFSDEFCARIFATTAFSIDMAINGLRMVGIDSIGPQSLREIAFRESSSPALVNRRIDQLKKEGIALDNSVFSVLVRNLATKGQSQLLEDVVNCDMHPEAFEDRELQESLLVTYNQNGDRRQADRTLAILTAKCSPDKTAIVHWNLLLRSALERRDRAHIYRILEVMQEKRLPVSAKSSYFVRTQLLSPRTVSKPPEHTDDLPSIIAIFQRILRTGGTVPTLEWREILRRLGMKGQLIEFEKIALWLADWYSSPSFRASQSSFFTHHHAHIPKDLSPRHRKHPLRIIFPVMAQQAIVAWGFQHPGDLMNLQTKLRNKGLNWRWGIELLRKLKQRKVPVLRSTLSHACKLRLIALFRQGESNRTINRRARMRNLYQIEYLAEEIEAAWGGDVFRLDPLLSRGIRGDWMG